MSSGPLFACIEAGGTKFMLGVARGPDAVLATRRVPTTDPAETIAATLAFFAEMRAVHGDVSAAGIASFGPVELDRRAPAWGHILTTPKRGWSGTDLAGAIGAVLDCPIGFDTDVNGAVLAEWRWGAAVGTAVAAYVTVGTGIGGGALFNGAPVHGLRHPEMGHILPRRHAGDADFAGICPFHGDCLEGLASGTAIAARWGCSLSDLAADHPGHAIIADYLAQLVIAQQALLSPQRIVMGGGVMAVPGLLARIRTRVAELAREYFGAIDPAALIVPPGLGDRAGLLGALALAQGALGAV